MTRNLSGDVDDLFNSITELVQTITSLDEDIDWLITHLCDDCQRVLSSDIKDVCKNIKEAKKLLGI